MMKQTFTFSGRIITSSFVVLATCDLDKPEARLVFGLRPEMPSGPFRGYAVKSPRTLFEFHCWFR